MPNGVYKIYAYTNFGLTSYSGYLNISWTVDYGMVYHQTVYSNIQPYVGGLRVKTISDYNPDSTIPAQVRQYEYLLDDETTSSGALGAYPVYSYPVYYDSRCACHSIGGDAENYPNLATSFNYLVRSSSSINDIAGVNGSPVTYQRVTEKLINNGMSNGKTVRYFTSFTENPPAIVQVFPFIPPLFYEWAYGLLTREKIYDAQNNLLKETDNTYNYGFDSYFYDSVRAENFRSVTIAPVRFNYSTDQTIDEFNHPLISQFPLYLRMTSFSPWSGRAELAKSTVTEFTPSGALATYDSTEYDPQNFYMKRKLSTDSKGRQSVSLFTYPYDRVQAGQDPGGLYQQMLNLNMFNVNLSDSAARDGSTVSVKTANYFNPSGTLFVPQTINVQNGSFAPETRLTYNTYDTHGNVTGATASDGIPQTYIYGYNAQFPIAKVLNANPGDVAFTSFETGETGGWTIGSGTYDSSTWLEGRKAFSLGSTVSKSGLSSSRTYVVSYWTQNSQPYTIAGTVSGYPVKGKTIAIGNGNWTLYEHRITGQTAISFSGSGYIDCLRLFPADAQMTTYTYSPLPGITTICTPDNKLTYYQYDELSRLQVIKDQDGNIIKTFDYHYNGQ
jgi:YD repeat-containing protein